MTNIERHGDPRDRHLSLPDLSGSQIISWAALASFVLIVLGAKFLLIQHDGSMVPYWDQWDGEADALYKPYLNSSLSIGALFSSHNEHRIFLTRILALPLLELGGGWNPLFQMIVNACLHVVALCILIISVFKILDSAQRGLFAFFTALVFALPIGYDNSLGGFQSQFYFLQIFSFLSIAAIVRAGAFSPLWWAGVAGSVLAYFSMASGALTVASIFVVVACQIAVRQRNGMKEIVAAAMLLAVTAVMLVFVTHIPENDVLGAHTLRQFVEACLIFLAYPFGPAGIFFCLPMIGYALFVIRTRPTSDSPHWVILGLIVWFLTQAASIAYGRATGPTTSRYLDLTLIQQPLNFGLLLFALRKAGACPRRYKITLAVTCLWLTFTATQLTVRTFQNALPESRIRHENSVRQENNVKSYLAGDSLALRNKPDQAIPYPRADRLEMLLSDPTIRLALPDGFRNDQDKHEFDKRSLLGGRTRAAVQSLVAGTLKHAYVFLGLGSAIALLTILLSLERLYLSRRAE